MTKDSHPDMPDHVGHSLFTDVVGKLAANDENTQFLNAPGKFISEAAYQGTIRAYAEMKAANDAEIAEKSDKKWFNRAGKALATPYLRRAAEASAEPAQTTR